MALQLMSIAALMATSANIYSKRSKLLGLDEYENGVSHKINMVKKKFGSLEQRLSHSVDDAVQKPFGAIYYNNKVVLYDPDTNILEIRMTMGTKTETAYSGFHVVRLAVYAPKGKLYNSLKDLYKGEIASKRIKTWWTWG